MKLTKLALLGALFIGVSQAATVTLSTGFAPGISVTEGGIASDGYSFTVGSWDGAVFTSLDTFASASGTTAISGDLASLTPTGLTGGPVFVLVTDTVGAPDLSGNYAILSTGGTFPDIGNAIDSTIVDLGAFGGSVALVANNNAAVADANTINFVPEPSIAMLGGLGLLGLLRRRR